MRIASLFICLALSTPALAQNKLLCSEVTATETKCKDHEVQVTACTAAVDAELKVRTDAAKKAFDDCKKKEGMAYLARCKTEMKASTKATQTPKQMQTGPIEKELTAKADSPCAKAQALSKGTEICRGPKKAFDAWKANCIKDPT